MSAAATVFGENSNGSARKKHLAEVARKRPGMRTSLICVSETEGFLLSFRDSAVEWRPRGRLQSEVDGQGRGSVADARGLLRTRMTRVATSVITCHVIEPSKLSRSTGAHF